MDVQLSVVIATLDRAHLLVETLAALGAQIVPQAVRWEIVVVDNGSQDHTADVVEAFAGTSGVPVLAVRESRLGLSHARNRGVAAARGEIIAFTDDDVIPSPDWVAAIIEAVAATGADGVGGRILPRWEAPPPDWLAGSRRLLAQLAVMDHAEPQLLELPVRGVPQVWGANMAFRRRTFEVIGGFDTRVGLRGRRLFRGEETNFVWRALKHGLRIAYAPSIVVEHRILPDRMQRSYFRRLAYDAGQSRAILLHGRRRRAVLGAPVRMYLLPARAIRWAWQWARRHPEAFERELRLRFALGQLTMHWRASFSRGFGSSAREGVDPAG